MMSEVINFLQWTGFYAVKYIAYIAVVVVAVLAGKAWSGHSKKNDK